MTVELSCDVLVIGGGTAGSMAAITAAEAGRDVLLLEKAHVRHSGALAMGMDGVNNAVIPGKARPEDYVAEITRANDGIVNQRTIMQTATRGFEMVQRLERYGVKFEKDSFGDYHVRQVHRSGSYVLPMPEGKDVKKVLYRVMRERRLRERLRIENRVMPVRVLVSEGRAVGAAGFNTRTGEFVTVSAGAVILATGASGRLGLPASGYLYGTYENPTNAGDGYSMAYHAGAELSGIECFQINPLIKDYNGPACAYVGNPFGAYQVNALGERFVDCDYWSGQMMAEVAAEIASARGPIYLKTTHLPEESISALEGILHSTERPSRGTFHSGRGHDYRTHDIEMHISEIGLCGGHSASGVWVDENGCTTVPGLYAAGDLACVPHNYMIGAFVFGDLAGAHAAENFVAGQPLPAEQVAEAAELIFRHSRNPDGPPQPQVEYKLRRFVNDYVAPPKTATKLSLALEAFDRMSAEIAEMGARSPHELMRCVEVSFIRDCAEMAAASSLMRDESRWGLYHSRVDLPERDDTRWFHHLNLRKNAAGEMEFIKRPVAEYLVPVDGIAHRAGSVEFLGVRSVSAASVSASSAAEEVVVESGRVLEVLSLVDSQPTLAVLEPYLVDPDVTVRRAAVSVLTEAVPAGFEFALVRAMADEGVRDAAAAGLRELVEVVPASDALREALERSPARAVALEVLWALKLGTAELYAAGLESADIEVRLAAVRGLVALREDALLAVAAADPARELRVQVAKGITDVGVLVALSGDSDVLVRAAALEAAGRVGWPPALHERAAGLIDDPAWEVRVGVARALDDPQLVAGLLDDPNLDVRKAAVRALERWRTDPGVVLALKRALDDTDADVRAYARMALG
ncbi:fumarate reductase/succinate dehydrogenase flavoprotein subunit [Lentzea flava]|uniref:Fumarate reductase/succinate dehydrogenase flavoprotein-like FrdA n=1 Tax=Lentzea flava TaxID=103732 RepID=A0ABQ2V9T1_9PSEU|nr:fumarate reductase/succinate dehydrogenase flavoprotein subunit [Lentzea flava]MCP2204074.1 Succinate dehydrogenase/fumarate reductase, flavoprotein subunit [Lentzea flava]GGU74381.1 fumarate reductase/succinate dehydrogenase flavoprotein-like FrdA [Lentzea flava]